MRHTTNGMKARILDGRREADRLLKLLGQRIARSKKKLTMATIMVGQRYDSALYIKLKTAAAKKIGIRTRTYTLPINTSQAALHKLIARLNRDRSITGILLQLPLPRHLDTNKIVATIATNKDADGFHVPSLVKPPTIAAVLRLMKMAKVKSTSSVIILGKKSVFNLGLQNEFVRMGMKVNIITPGNRIPLIVKKADVIITVLGHGPRLSAKNIKFTAVVIDVGIRRQGKRTVGDVDPLVWKKARAISPVPGGVGPLTIYFLLRNIYQLDTI